MLRRLRGILGTALTWALVWLPLGFLVPLLRRPPSECLYCPPDWFGRFLLLWVLWGAVSGAVFAVVLMIAERSRSLLDLSLLRTASWGAIGAIALPLLATIIDVNRSTYWSMNWQFIGLVLAVSAGLGAVCAAATLAMVRRGRASGSASGGLTSA